MNVNELMAKQVKCCAISNTLNIAAQLMWENDVGCVPVVDHDGRVIGVVTDRDICMAAYIQGLPLTALLVTSAMSKEVYSCTPDDNLTKAERLMREKQVRRLLVIDPEEGLVGIVSLSDIAREAERQARAVTDAELTRVLASVCTPRHHIR